MKAAVAVLTAVLFATAPAVTATAVPIFENGTLAVAGTHVSEAQKPPRRASRYQDSGARMWARYPSWIRAFGLCVRKHESIRAGHYRAQNPYSSASGAYQFIDFSWRTLSRRAGLGGYSRAVYAPPSVQDAVFAYTVAHGGAGHWNGTSCGHGAR